MTDAGYVELFTMTSVIVGRSLEQWAGAMIEDVAAASHNADQWKTDRPATSSRLRVDSRHTDRNHTVRNADPWIGLSRPEPTATRREPTGVHRSGRRRLVVAPPAQVALELPGDGISTGLGKVGGVRRLLEVVDVLGHLVV